MLNDIKSTLFNVTRNVTKHSGDLLKTTKLSVNLAQEQEALKILYTEIGKKVHEIYQYGGSLGKFFDEKYREIEAAERKIDTIKEEIAKIKGVKECPKCGKQVDKLAEFCPKCGLRLDGIPAGEIAPGAPGMPVNNSERNSVTGYMGYYSEEPGGQASAAPPAETYGAAFSAPAPQPELPPVSAPPPAAAAPAVAAPSSKIICRVCGTENEAGTKFCLSCGRYL